MGTRGAYGFRINETDKVMYNQFDTYPDGLGVIMCQFVIDTPFSTLKRVAEDIVLIDGDSKPTSEQISLCMEFADLTVSEQSYDDWYCLLRNAQNSPEIFRDTGLIYMLDAAAFLADSLFCEWAYIINIDTKKLEFYTGFNQDTSAPGRYASIRRKLGDEYCGIRHILSIPLIDFRRKAYKKIADELSFDPYFGFKYGDECQKVFLKMLDEVMESRPRARARRPTVYKNKVIIKEGVKGRKLCLGSKRITERSN